MSFNLVESVKGLITPDLVSGAASRLGENPASISRAMDAAIPVLLSGVLNKAATGGSSVLTLAQTAASGGITDNLGPLFGTEHSSTLNEDGSLLSQLFENKAGLLSGLLSGFAGIRSSSAEKLLIVLAPLVMGVIGKHAVSNNLDARSLNSFLSGQKDIISKAIPPGLNLSGLYEETPTMQSAFNEQEISSGLPGWLLPLMLLLAGGLLIFYFLRGCGNKKEVTTKETTAFAIPAAAPGTRI